MKVVVCGKDGKEICVFVLKQLSRLHLFSHVRHVTNIKMSSALRHFTLIIESEVKKN